MSRLSKQSIRALCEGPAPMIHPFEPDKVRVQGVSKGLSHASYDASIAHDLVLGRHPGYVIKEWVYDTFGHMDGNGKEHPEHWYQWPSAVYYNIVGFNKLLTSFLDLRKRLRDEPPAYSLAHTIEDFNMPPDVGGDVADKSTFARVFVSAYNTFFDPGFHGNATLELVNDSDKRVSYKAGQGVCQFIFTWLDEATEDPYSGKYQGQTKAAHAARYEGKEGTVVAMPDLLPQPRTEDEVKQLEEELRAADIRMKTAVVFYWPQAVPDEIDSSLREKLAEALAKVDAVKKKEPMPGNDLAKPGMATPTDLARVRTQLDKQNHQRLERVRDAHGLGQG